MAAAPSCRVGPAADVGSGAGAGAWLEAGAQVSGSGGVGAGRGGSGAMTGRHKLDSPSHAKLL